MLYKFAFDKLKIIQITLVWGILYAASDEIHQYFIPGRHAEFADWIADSLGVVLSLLLIKFANFDDE